MLKFIFISCLLFFTAFSTSIGAKGSYCLLSLDEGIFLLQAEDSGTQSEGTFPVQDLNEDENDLILALPCLHFINSLAILNSLEHSTASLPVEVIPRPPRG